MTENANYYMSVPYAVKVIPSENGYFARVEDLPGCRAWADTLEDLWPAVEEAKRAWIEEALRSHKRIPKPAETEQSLQYSGRILVRMPKSLHADLTKRASIEGVSLNQFIITVLARAVGFTDTS